MLFPWTTGFPSGPRLSCSSKGPSRFAFVAVGRMGASLLAAFNRFPLCKLLVASVNSTTAAALKLLLLSTPLHKITSLTISNTVGCTSAIALHMAESLAALALQRALWGDIRLCRDSQGAEFSLKTHLRHFMSPRYWHYRPKVRG